MRPPAERSSIPCRPRPKHVVRAGHVALSRYEKIRHVLSSPKSFSMWALVEGTSPICSNLWGTG